MGAVLTVVAFIALVLPDKPIRHTNIELVLDHSERMREAAPSGATKLEDAVAELGNVVKPADDGNVGLRTLGGGCDGRGELAVDIGTGHADDIKRAAGDVRPEGAAPLGAAILAAAADLGDTERFPPGVSRRIVVITAGTDSCARDAAREVRERLDADKLEVDFRLVGVAVPPDEQPALEELAGEFHEGRAVFAADRDELRRALDDVIRREPVVQGANAVIALGNDAVDDLQQFADTIDTDPDAAEEAIERADVVLERSQLPFEALEPAEGERGKTVELHDRVAELRQLQRALLDAARDSLEPARSRSDDPTAQKRYDEAIGAFDEAVTKHNEKVGEVEALAGQIG